MSFDTFGVRGSESRKRPSARVQAAQAPAAAKCIHRMAPRRDTAVLKCLSTGGCGVRRVYAIGLVMLAGLVLTASASGGVYVADWGGGVSMFNQGVDGILNPTDPSNVAAGDDPYGVAVSPNGEYAYVTNNEGAGIETVSEYSIASDGVLSPLPAATIGAGGGPDGIVVSPNGKYVYVANENSDEVSQYTVGPGGELVADSPEFVGAGAGPAAIAVSPNGQYVYVGDTNESNSSSPAISQYTVGADGKLTLNSTTTGNSLDAPGAYPGSIAISSTVPRVPRTYWGPSTGARSTNRIPSS